MSKFSVALVFNVDWFAYSHFRHYIEELKSRVESILIVAEDTGVLCQFSSSNTNIYSAAGNRSMANIRNQLNALICPLIILLRHKPASLEVFSLKPIILWSAWAFLFRIRNCCYYFTGLGSILSRRETIGARLLGGYIKLFCDRRSTKIIVENTSMEKYFIEYLSFSKASICLLPGVGVDTALFAPMASRQTQQSTKLKVLMMSRLLVDKGVLEYCTSAHLLSSLPIQFFLAGKYDPINPTSISSHFYNALVNGNVKEVSYLGHWSNPAEYLPSFDLFVLPSYHEGLSKSLCEALSCGLPVITTNVAGCREVIQSSYNPCGLQVPPRNPELLSNAIKYLVSNRSVRYDMSIAARLHAVASYDVITISQLHAQLFLEPHY